MHFGSTLTSGSAYLFRVPTRCWFCVLCLAIGVSNLTARGGGAAGPAAAPAAVGDRAAEFKSKVQPLLQKYCYECHGDGNTAGDLDLDKFHSTSNVLASKTMWSKVVRYARTQVMPPPEAELQPTQDQRDQFVAALQRQLYDPNKPDPGRVTIRRLNRTEYRNTVRDLLGVGFDPTIDFPQDDTGYGFDNIADVLTLPPMLMEKYLVAAEKILDEALPTDQVEQIERNIDATEANATFKNRQEHSYGDGWVSLSSKQEDALFVAHDAPAPGEYIVRVLAYAKYPGPPPIGFTEHPPLKMSLMLGDAVVREIDVNADHGDPKWYEARMGVPAGRQQFRVALRRLRGLAEDRTVSDARVGVEQPGDVYIKGINIIGPVSGAVRRVAGDRIETIGSSAGRIPEGGGAALRRTDDEAIANINIAADGKYLIRAQAYAEYAGDRYARMELRLDDKPLKVFDVAAPAARKAIPGQELGNRARRAVPQVYQIQSDLKAGQRKLSARFLNNFRDDENPDPNFRDRNLIVQHFEVVELSAPPLSPPMTEPMRRLFAKFAPTAKDAGDAQARALLADFARRAWRRPPQGDDVDRLVKLYTLARENGESFHGCVKHAMKAILVSPNFLFRGGVEADADKQPHAVSEFELASRLSYFLWSTTPDNDLLDLAQRGELHKNLDAQVKRMLASPKSQAFVDNFAGQWLQFRNLDAAHPDEKMFEKAYDDRLRDAMKRETQMFFESILKEDRSLLDVLTADYTFLNERLAKHYGINGVSGENFRRVSLKDTPRRGVMTQGSVLTLTSNPTRTSPVKRGKWVLQNLLGAEPPPPLPNVPPLVKDDKPLVGTRRQRLEQHRADPTCSSCHAPMDPIGFGLENFDAVGRWRDKEANLPIDSSSAFVTGEKFRGAVELTQLLAKTRKNDFYRSVTENALTFALGRGVEPYDQPAIDSIVDDLRKNDGKLSSLIAGVVKSVPFQMRRGGAGGAGDGDGNERSDRPVAQVPPAGVSKER